MRGPLGDPPSIAIAADQASRRIDRSSARAIALRLALLVSGATAGALTWSFVANDRMFDVGGLIGVLAFLGLLYLRFLHEGEAPATVASAAAKAAAARELAISHSWRYALAAAPYSEAQDDPENRLRYHDALRDLERVLLQLRQPILAGEQLTEGMQRLRSEGFEEKTAAYLDDRILPSIESASSESIQLRQRAQRLSQALFLLELLGLCGGVLRAFGVVMVDLLGITGVAVASLGIWIAFRDYKDRADRMAFRLSLLGSSRDLIRLASNDSELAARVGRVEDQLTLEAQALLSGSDDEQPLSPDTSAGSSIHSMSPQEYYDAVFELEAKFRGGGQGIRKFDPDVVVGLNYGGAIVAGFLFGSKKNFDFVPLSLRSTMRRDAAETYVDLLLWEGMQRGDSDLKILVVDASTKSGDSMATAVGVLTTVLGRRGWVDARSATQPEQPGERRYDIRTAVLVYRPEEGRPPAVPIDYVVNNVTQRFPYGAV